MNKAVIPYGRQSINEEDVAAVVQVLKGDYLTTGPWIDLFQKAVAEYVGAMYAVAVSSGTAALHLACLAAGIGPGDEVIVTPMSFAASANCLLYVGARPVFADIDASGNIDPEEIEKKISKATRAIIPVHYGGLPCQMAEIAKIANRHGLTVIEDACHALGAYYRGQKTGNCSHSDMAAFSFHPVKHITTGEGGMVTTNSHKLFKKIRELRSHGIVRQEEDFQYPNQGGWYYEMQHLGYNYRMTDIQAALGLSQLKKLDGFVQRRRDIAQAYNQAFQGLPLDLPGDTGEAKHAYHLYAVKLQKKAPIDRKTLYEGLRSRGIFSQVHYIPIHTMPYYRSQLGTGWGQHPCAEDHYQRVLSLPLYPALTDKEVDMVIEAVKECCRAGGSG